MQFIQAKPLIRMGWLEYMCLISAVPNAWKDALHSADTSDQMTKEETIRGQCKVSQWVYKDMNHTEKILVKVSDIWNKKLNVSCTWEDYANLFKAIKRITSVVKLQNFQYRLLHNKIFCNDVLVHW